jgi:hypothetical protein
LAPAAGFALAVLNAKSFTCEDRAVFKRLLLAIPPCFTNRDLDFEIGFPVHLALLGQVARGMGWNVDYLDMTLEEKEGYDSFALLDRLLAQPDLALVGVSNHTVRTSVTTRTVAERVKAGRPDLLVVVGGVNATFMWRELLDECLAIDVILRGYAQSGLRALLASLEAESEDLAIPGAAMRSGPSFRLDPMESPVAADFACLSLEGLEVDRYLKWTRSYSLLTHTGCGFSCNFCTSVMPGPYQSREVRFPVDQIVGEMGRALTLGFGQFFMSANIFTSDRKHCLELCEAICKSGISEVATWSCMTRVEFVDDELLSAMREAGCIDVAFGVETAGQDQWRSLRKGNFSSDRIFRAFEACRHSSLSTTAYLMLGAPEQTEEDIESTVQLVRALNPDYRVVSFFQPFPGTPYWGNLEKFGLSDVAPLNDWNFHEAPICRTRYLSKEDLVRAAIRLHLDRGESPPLLPENDALHLVDLPEGYLDQLPLPAQKALVTIDGKATIEAILRQVTALYGARGSLIALYVLSASIREGWVCIVQPWREQELAKVALDNPIYRSRSHVRESWS